MSDVPGSTRAAVPPSSLRTFQAIAFKIYTWNSQVHRIFMNALRMIPVAAIRILMRTSGTATPRIVTVRRFVRLVTVKWALDGDAGNSRGKAHRLLDTDIRSTGRVQKIGLEIIIRKALLKEDCDTITTRSTRVPRHPFQASQFTR